MREHFRKNGDISPQTELGRAVAALIMILGYSIIVIPTGIIAAGATRPSSSLKEKYCAHCGYDSHESDAVYCKRCGQSLATKT